MVMHHVQRLHVRILLRVDVTSRAHVPPYGKHRVHAKTESNDENDHGGG